MTTTIMARSDGKASDLGAEGEVVEGEGLAEEGGLEGEGDDEGVWDAEGEVELEIVAK